MRRFLATVIQFQAGWVVFNEIHRDTDLDKLFFCKCINYCCYVNFYYMGDFVWFQAQSLFVDAFLHNNRLEHLIQLMGYHPKYLDCFLKTQQFILRGDGPLPQPYRHYIAIMVSHTFHNPLRRLDSALCAQIQKYSGCQDHLVCKSVLCTDGYKDHRM